jgi:hypothetical protein
LVVIHSILLAFSGGLLRCRRNFNVAGMEVISFHGHLAFYNCEDVELAWRSSWDHLVWTTAEWRKTLPPVSKMVLLRIQTCFDFSDVMQCSFSWCDVHFRDCTFSCFGSLRIFSCLHVWRLCETTMRFILARFLETSATLPTLSKV